MKNLTKYGSIVLIALGFLLGLWGVWNSWVRSAVPFKWKNPSGQIVISKTQPEGGGLEIGDIVLRIGQVDVKSGREINFALDGTRVGDQVTMRIRRGEQEIDAVVTLARHTTWVVTLVNLLLGILMMGVGAGVFLSKSGDRPARVFWGLTFTLGLSILISTSRLPAGAAPWNFILPIVYWLVYPLFPAFFLRFTTIFPREKLVLRSPKLQTILIFSLAAIFIVWLQAAQMPVLLNKNQGYLGLYYQGVNWHRVYIILVFLASLTAFLHSLLTAKTKSEKDKVRWILLGIAIGCAPFIGLWTLPQVIGFQPLVPEEITSLALLIAPISFAVAIVKYRVLDIDVVINRSIVYALTSGLVLCGYALVSGLAGHFLLSISPETNRNVTILVTAAAAILFHPVKQRIQYFVDRTFYRIKYNYRLATKAFGQKIVTTRTQAEAFDLLSKHIREALPLEKLAILMKTEHKFETAKDFQVSDSEKTRLESNETGIFLRQAVQSARTALEGTDHVSYSELDPPLANSDWKILLPLFMTEDECGVLLLGQKLSGRKYSDEDIEISSVLAAETANAISRIRFQEAIIQERAEREKLQALNRLQDEKNRELEIKNQEITRTQEQLVTQEKLASLGRLTAGIAHEIKNPLNFVTNFAQLSGNFTKKLAVDLKRRQNHFEKTDFSKIESNLNQIELLNRKINEHGKRADSIVRNMMEHARTGKGERQLTEVNNLLDESAALVYHGMRARQSGFNTAFEKDYDETLQPVPLISQDVSRVFLNIIGNGCYAVDKRRREREKETGSDGVYEPTVWLKTRNCGDTVEIRIRDNGTGMPGAVRKQIFEPFFTTKPTGEGTGLGLSISFDIIVKGHGGELRVKSQEGEFTEFIIVLPNA